jgi:hypothetical protein
MELTNQYKIDVFDKYKQPNITPPNVFVKYFQNRYHDYPNKKVLDRDIFDRPDIKNKLNAIIISNVPNEDENIYRQITKPLNELNNNSNEGFTVAYKAISNIKYTKHDHFKKLSQIVIDKAINEPIFSPLYATLVYNMAIYFIVDDNKNNIYFRRIFVEDCYNIFRKYTEQFMLIQENKYVGLMKFLGELYNVKFFPYEIMKDCMTSLFENSAESYAVARALSELITTISELLFETDTNEFTKLKEYLNNKIKIFEEKKYPLKNVFMLKNAQDKMMSFK